MSTIRKGASVGPRKPKLERPSWQRLTHTSVDDCRSSILLANKEELIDAHRWCERNPLGQKTRKALLAAALKKRVLAEQTEANMKSGIGSPVRRGKRGRR